MLERRDIKLSEQIVELFAKGLRIVAAGDHEEWEGSGGRRAEFIALDKRLNSLLDRPWQPSLFDKDLDRKSPPLMNPQQQLFRNWAPAQKLRRALLEEVERRKTLAKGAAAKAK
jgi:hypothetical protein